MKMNCFSFFLCHFPFKFLMGSHQVLNMFPRFPMCSPRVFPIAPCFKPICFAQSPSLLIYISGPKGDALHLSIESSILGRLHSFIFFGMGQSNWLVTKKKRKVGLVYKVYLNQSHYFFLDYQGFIMGTRPKIVASQF